MDRQIPSYAFLKIGQRLLENKTSAVTTGEPIHVNVICDDSDSVSIYDILREWASLLVEYFGEYI